MLGQPYPPSTFGDDAPSTRNGDSDGSSSAAAGNGHACTTDHDDNAAVGDVRCASAPHPLLMLLDAPNMCTGKRKGWTPLACAVKKGDLPMVLHLLRHGANASAPDAR